VVKIRKQQPSKKKRISFKAKESTACPVCRYVFHREELLSGGGRLIAGKLTLELRRLYETSKKYGDIYPLSFILTVCPKCYFTSFPKDFNNLIPEELKRLKENNDSRRLIIQKIFGKLDFNESRNLVLGAASYLLAVDCYHFRAPEVAPTSKKAICALRAAWLFSDISQKVPDRPFDKARDFYYLKAVNWYKDTLDILQRGSEPVDAVASILGPDIDQNWGFDGVMYLNGYLTLKFKDILAPEQQDQIRLLMITKKFLSKLYGTGKSSKSKPSEIVDMAKDVYDDINKMISKLGHDPSDYRSLKL
jgi:uncharacterized protein (DUF2225 family)